MKITSIEVQLHPSKGEENKDYAFARLLVRGEDKRWKIVESEGRREIGLLPFEVALATQLQNVINTFNGSDKRNLQ